MLAICHAGPIAAHEFGDFGQNVAGVSIGDAAGAAPPPGFYLENTFLAAPVASGRGQVAGLDADGALNVMALFWSTGWNILGGSAVMGASLSTLNVDVWPVQGGAVTDYPTLHDTWLMPLSVSWNIGHGWFVSSSFAFYVPDGSHSPGTINPDYPTYELSGNASYLAQGWDLTARLVYDINTPSAGYTGAYAGTPFAPFGSGYLSGDQMYLDLTATRTFDKLEIGPVGYMQWQTTADRPGGGVSCATVAAATASQLPCGRATDYAVGGLVGYNFGDFDLKMYVTDSVYTRDAFGALKIWAKVEVPLGAAGGGSH